MIAKYKIESNGNDFVLYRRIFLFFWERIWSYATLTEAVAALKNLIKLAQWREYFDADGNRL